MNFLEAVKSDKFVRRPENFLPDGKTEMWFKCFFNGGTGIYAEVYYPPSYDGNTDRQFRSLMLEDVLAEDWVVKEDELLPCPLCGCSVELGEEEPSHEEGLPKPGKVYIKCSNSNCIMEIEELLKFTKKEEFIEKWNNRVGGVRND